MTAMLLCSNPKFQYLAHKADIDLAIKRVLDSGWYILGKEVAAFEQEFAAYIGVRFGVGVANGTDALHLALVACGIKPGDEVITVSHTAVATVSAIELAGGSPVLVDIDPQTFTLDPAALAKAISPRTKAIIPVHLYGQSVDLSRILPIAKEHNLKVIEDCSQAHAATHAGRKVGSFGDIACFSFYPTKNLGALGDGGMVVTSDPQLHKNLLMLREYGWEERYISKVSGWNSRLDELQAAVLRVKLTHLDADTVCRIKIADAYDHALAGLPGLTLPIRRPGSLHVFHLYVIQLDRRDALLAHMKAQGIAPGIHYPMPIHLQPAYQNKIGIPGPMLSTERAARRVLSLPMYPELTSQDVEAVTASVRDFFARI